MIFSRLVSLTIIICLAAVISGCASGQGSSTGYYGYRYGPDPWYNHGGYVRDRVHVVSEEEIRALEEIDTVDLPSSPDPGFDAGFGDMDFGGGDFDF